MNLTYDPRFMPLFEIYVAFRLGEMVFTAIPLSKKLPAKIESFSLISEELMAKKKKGKGC